MWKRLRLTLEMIKFEHSVFALPFALTGALLAFRESGLRRRRGIGRKCCGSWSPWWGRARPPWRSTAWWMPTSTRAIRARGMRHLPAGLLWPRVRMGLRGGLRGAVLPVRGGELNRLCLRLAPVALAIVFFYSFTKRFTSFSHLVLGFAWGSRRPPPGSPCAARSIRASCG